MAEDNSEKGFVIKDRRRFDEEGKKREEEAEDTKVTSPPEEKVKNAAKESPKQEKEEYKVPEVNFHNFLISLYTSVIFNLGEIADPVSGKKEKNMAVAQQTIDILALLKEKTAGNLDSSEKDLLEGILSEARMRYVRESEKR